MATDKVYTVAGTSTLNGEMKVRFANDTMRIKVLAKHGHEDITLIELPSAMSKVDAVKFIKAIDEFSGVAEQSAIADYLDRKDEAPKAKTAPVVAVLAKTAPKAAPKAKATKATAKVVDTSAMDENIPF